MSMDRVRTFGERGAIGSVLASLPAGIARRLEGVRFVSDVSPRYLGIHGREWTNDGRSYDQTSHAVWRPHQMHRPAPERGTTVVLLDGDAFDPLVVLHELGHALDERLGFASFNPATGAAALPMRPMDSYAASHPTEAFATGFQSWATTDPVDRFGYHNEQELRAADPALAAFFDRLSEAP